MARRSFDNRRSWIARRTLEGAPGRREIHRFFRRVYQRPLASAVTSGNGGIRPAPDAARRFLEAMAAHEMLVPLWQGSELRLRDWLLEEFWRSLRETAEGAGKEPPESVRSRHAVLSDVSFLAEALRRVRILLEERERGRDWSLYRGLDFEKRDLRDVIGRYDVDAAECRAVVAAVRRKVRIVLRSLLARDGVPPSGIDQEVRETVKLFRHPHLDLD